MRIGVVAVLWAVLVASFPTGGLAQTMTSEEEAHMRFDLGRRYYDNGRFSDAAQEFQRAYALHPVPDLLYNLYLAYRDAGEDAPAADALRRYLADLPEGEHRAQLEARLATLERRLASPTPADDSEAASATEPTATSADEPTVQAPPQPPASSSHALDPVPWVIVGVGGVMLAASIATGVLALDDRSTLASQCSAAGACDASLATVRDRGQTLSIATDVLWPAGAVVAGIGLVLGILDLTRGDPEVPTVTAMCTGTGCIATIGGTL